MQNRGKAHSSTEKFQIIGYKWLNVVQHLCASSIVAMLEKEYRGRSKELSRFAFVSLWFSLRLKYVFCFPSSCASTSERGRSCNDF